MNIIKSKRYSLILVFLLITILLISFISAYVYSNPKYTQSGFGYGQGLGFGFTGSDYFFDNKMCEAGQDFILQISPLGCTPSVVRSDLLEDQNVQVFCPILATKLNPLIDVEGIDYLTFSGTSAPGVSDIGFHPARSALGYKNDLNSPVLENIGYAVIELKRNPSEANMPDFVEGNVTAIIFYDIKNAFGVGDASFYLKPMSDEQWNKEFQRYGFWKGRGFIRAEGVDSDGATISIYTGNTIVSGSQSFKQKITTLSLKEGESSRKIYLPTFDYCAGGLQVKLEGVKNPDTTAKFSINSEEVEVARGEKFLNGRCAVRDLKVTGLNQEARISCTEDTSEGFFGSSTNLVLKISPRVSLEIDGKTQEYEIGDRLYNGEEKSVYLAYAYTDGDSTLKENLKVSVVAIPKQPEWKTKLSEDEISSFQGFIERYRNDRGSEASGFWRESLEFFKSIGYSGEIFTRWAVSGESFFVIGYQNSENIDGKIVKINGLSQPYDLEIIQDNSDYKNAIGDFDNLISGFSDIEEIEKVSRPYGERALVEKIELARATGQRATMVKWCEEFRKTYSSKNQTLLPQECFNDLEISNSNLSTASVLIEGEVKEISLRAVSEPTFEEYNAEILVEFPDGAQKTVKLEKNGRVYLGAQKQTVEQDSFSWPFEENRITSCYGSRDINGGSDYHDGIDLGGDGLKVFAAGNGEVVHICEGYCRGYGTNIVIKHPSGYYTVYNHLKSNSPKVDEGDNVRGGQEIALSGNTGYSLGSHLHFGVYSDIGSDFYSGRIADKGINPLCFLSNKNAVFDSNNCKATYEENLAGCENVAASTEEQYIQLISLDDESAEIRTNLGGKIFTSNLGKESPKEIQNYRFTLKQSNIKKVAKVSILSSINRVKTESNLKFRIEIEKRNLLPLSPEKTKERIEKVGNSIETLDKVSDGLGKTVKTLKGACLATGTALTLKNIVENSGGKGIARQEVMRGEGGWYERCAGKINSGLYKTQDECLIKEADQIDAEVEIVHQTMEQQNLEIKQLQDKNLVPQNKKFLGEDLVNTAGFLNDYSEKVANSILKESIKNAVNSGQSTKIDFEILSQAFLKREGYSVEELRKIDLYSRLVENQDSDIQNIAIIRLRKVLGDVEKNSKENFERATFAEKFGFDEAYFSAQERIKEFPISETKTFGEVKNKFTSYPPIKDNELVVIYKDRATAKEYLLTLDDDYVVSQTYSITGTSLNVAQQDNINPFSLGFNKFDEASYKNKFISSSGSSSSRPEIRYFETEPFKGLPAVVPYDLENGWYAASKGTLPVGANIRSYDASGRVNSFYLCNIGKNGIEEFNSQISDDVCQLIDLSISQTFSQFYGLSKTETEKNVECAVNAIEQASRAYKSGVQNVRINTQCGVNNIAVGRPEVEIPNIQCQDFMSPKECNLLFNTCDPVICPSSRCDFGGAYPVKDVIQSGVVGSAALCLPNAKEKIAVPICLTGVQAGIDGFNSVQKAYRECLQTSLDTGQTVGVCDEIRSVYMCEFLWRQAVPLAKVSVPKVLSNILNQDTRGGGEYLGFQNAWESAGKSTEYLTQVYGVNSYKAFQARSAETIGTPICKNFVSMVGPRIDLTLDALTEPDSPAQFHGRFDEIPFTTATVPPVSQYKVFYNIYAGKDKGAYYQVYLRQGPTSSFYQDTAFFRMVANGYIAAGESSSETRDFTAPSGYKELCIMVNGQEECGFKEVSTSFAVDYIESEYIKEQATKTDIRSENECISGTVSVYNLLTPNIQSAAEGAINPEIYGRGITRICATNNPGKGSDVKIGTEEQRWVDVGYCGDQELRCWLDRQSLEDSIDFANIEEKALKEVAEFYKEKAFKEGDYVSLSDEIESIEGENDLRKRISRIDEVIDRVFFNREKAKLFFMRGEAYSQLAINAYKNWEKKKVEAEAAERAAEKKAEKEAEEKEKELKAEQDAVMFEFEDGTLSNNVCYAFFDGEWHWGECSSFQYVRGGPSISRINWKLLNDESVYTELNEKDGNFLLDMEILLSENPEEKYREGLKMLIDRTLDNNEGGFFADADLVSKRILSKDKVAEMDALRIFTVYDSENDYQFYVNYDSSGNKWQWNFENNEDLFDEFWKDFKLFESTDFYDGAIKILNGSADLSEASKISYSAPAFGISDKYDSIIEKYSMENGVDSNLIKAMISVESNFNERAVSSAGAAGLMQLMPDTAREMGLKVVIDGKCIKSDISGCNYVEDERFNAEKNIEAGTKLIARLLNGYSQYKDSEKLALAAYNGGKGTISGAISKTGKRTDLVSWEDVKTQISSKETKEYPEKVLRVKESLVPFSEDEQLAILSARECSDCGDDKSWWTFGLGNSCDEIECRSIGEQIGKECIFYEVRGIPSCGEKNS